ncbi:MAG TPA: hypothetical protein VM370_04345 [Candidatus Thermoplasmatota archaeon]|nr:hypothetical protein [Candidatus Thermoplasmatota archaeon]
MAVSSTSAGIFHQLYYLYMAIALVVGALVLGWLAYSLIKFRARPGVERPRDAPRAGVLPAERGHPLWSYVMALVIAGIMFGLAFGTISAVHTLEEPPHEGERVMANVTGFQFGWRFTQYGEGGVPIAKVTDWTIPVDTPIVADVQSKDVWHNFAIPDFRIRIDVIPGQVNHIWWEAHETGEVLPVCVQICGVGHALMHTNMHVVTKDEWKAYVADESAKEYAKLEKAGQVVNVTYDGATFATETKTLAEGKPFAYRLTNAGAEATSFVVDGSAGTTAHDHPGLVTIAPGAAAYLFASHADAQLQAVIE